MDGVENTDNRLPLLREGPHLLLQLSKLYLDGTRSVSERLPEVYHECWRIIRLVCQHDQVLINTRPAQISYLCHRYELPERLEQQLLYLWRNWSAGSGSVSEAPQLLATAVAILSRLIEALSGASLPHDLAAVAQATLLPSLPAPARVQAHSLLRAWARAGKHGQQHLEAHYNGRRTIIHLDRATATFDSLRRAATHITRGFTIHLLDVHEDEGGALHPGAVVVDPDYLFDVSAIAECVQPDGRPIPLLYVLRKFLPRQPDVKQTIGTVANFLLDVLMHRPEASFDSTFKEVFQQEPLLFSCFSDDEIREIHRASYRHFSTIKQLLKSRFAEEQILPHNTYLEPTFFSAKYGIQGRLDLLSQQESERRATIVELKSGSVFRPNQHGLNQSHYVQTLLYDLLLRSAYDTVEPWAFILYSGEEQSPLRYAPPNPALVQQLLEVRNQLAVLEYRLAHLPLSDPAAGRINLLDELIPELAPTGFTGTRLLEFRKTLLQASEVERKYFDAFVGFIAREQRLSRTGDPDNERQCGVAGLWLRTTAQKLDQFDVLSALVLQHYLLDRGNPMLHFCPSEPQLPLSNFREGDLCLLYRTQGAEAEVLQQQVFKGTIIVLEPNRVVVRLKHPQSNQSVFAPESLWNIEHDALDSSFVSQYRALYEWLRAPVEARRLLLTLQPPRTANPPVRLEVEPAVSSEQRRILSKALSSPDYFLLLGPPGTGKTQLMLRNLVRHLLYATDERILLLAYTHRAVDEMCEAIEDLYPREAGHYLRLGSRYSSDTRFAHRLLSEVVAPLEQRSQVRELLQRTRVMVATIATLQARPELLLLQQFETVVIDEASQILEPMLVGLLPRFRRFILIGDHKQLPAVVAQDPLHTQVKDPDLLGIGLTNLRNSLFERLYQYVQREGLDYAYDQLQHQGRMHRDIMQFAARQFYHNRLLPLGVEADMAQWQCQPLQYEQGSDMLLPPEVESLLLRHRFCWIDAPALPYPNPKTNAFEALWAARIARFLYGLYRQNGMPFSVNHTLGVITPYRSQIAQVRAALPPEVANISVDTVERYQGSAREIIIISLCANAPYQLQALTSLSDDGLVDRKLNVALTRARKHLVLLGNMALLQTDSIYRLLLEHLRERGAVLTPPPPTSLYVENT